MNNSPFNLDGKIVVITGGYGYLGKAMSIGLMEHNANVFVIGRDENKFKSAFGDNAKINFIKGDIGYTSSIKEGIESIIVKQKKIDVLINNAFYLAGQDPLNISDENWAYSLEGSLSSVYKCTKIIAPYMIKAKYGRIINISSMYGMVSPDFDVYEQYPQYLNPPHYGACKASIIQLTKYFASYLGKQNVTVNCVSPGPFPSEKVQENEGFIKNLSKKTTLNRIGSPKELVGPIVFLSSDASSYVNGHNLVVDGGWTIL